MRELDLAIDHVALNVEDLGRAVAFYKALLQPLGLELVAEVPANVTGSVDCAGFGRGRKSSFWLAEGGPTTPRTHIAFRTETREQVAAFHAAGLEAGGRDNGAPGVREAYHPDYFAAFVFDPEGHNIEAVSFEESLKMEQSA